MNFTLKGFELVEVAKGRDMDYEEIPEIGIYAKKLEYYGFGEPEIRTFTVFSDIRDGEILEVFVVKNRIGGKINV